MTSDQTVETAAPSRPELVDDKRVRMLAAAEHVFLTEGYHASMDTIAARAQVAKQTVYNHFGSKEGLFSEVVRRMADHITDSLADPNLDLHAALLAFAMSLRVTALSPQGVNAFRALVAEAPRFPELALLIYAKGPRAGRDALSALLERHMRLGALRKEDPKLAAEMFLGMLTGYDRVRALFGAREPNSRADEARHCERIVGAFMRALAPAGDTITTTIRREGEQS
jgi:TetR/AcrR family transcriptional regulator, mexJK operon transcriptional repressor